MTTSYQHKIIADHLQGTWGQSKKWPFRSALEIEKELCRGDLSLFPGEYLVVALSDSGGWIGKVTGLDGMARFPSTSLVIPFHQLERAFHEQHTDWVEL